MNAIKNMCDMCVPKKSALKGPTANPLLLLEIQNNPYRKLLVAVGPHLVLAHHAFAGDLENCCKIRVGLTINSILCPAKTGGNTISTASAVFHIRNRTVSCPDLVGFDDFDGDGVDDEADSCILVANAGQADNDGQEDDDPLLPGLQEYADACGAADFDGDGLVAAADFFSTLLPSLGGPPGPGLTVPSSAR